MTTNWTCFLPNGIFRHDRRGKFMLSPVVSFPPHRQCPTNHRRNPDVVSNSESTCLSADSTLCRIVPLCPIQPPDCFPEGSCGDFVRFLFSEKNDVLFVPNFKVLIRLFDSLFSSFTRVFPASSFMSLPRHHASLTGIKDTLECALSVQETLCFLPCNTLFCTLSITGFFAFILSMKVQKYSDAAKNES